MSVMTKKAPSVIAKPVEFVESSNHELKHILLNFNASYIGKPLVLNLSNIFKT